MRRNRINLLTTCILFINFMFPPCGMKLYLRFLRVICTTILHSIRQLKVREEGREGEPGTVRVFPANKTLFLNYSPPAARRA
jgi:hypothetical protein